jgi:hypothetical protein
LPFFILPHCLKPQYSDDEVPTNPAGAGITFLPSRLALIEESEETGRQEYEYVAGVDEKNY